MSLTSSQWGAACLNQAVQAAIGIVIRHEVHGLDSACPNPAVITSQDAGGDFHFSVEQPSQFACGFRIGPQGERAGFANRFKPDSWLYAARSNGGHAEAGHLPVDFRRLGFRQNHGSAPLRDSHRRFLAWLKRPEHSAQRLRAPLHPWGGWLDSFHAVCCPVRVLAGNVQTTLATWPDEQNRAESRSP